MKTVFHCISCIFVTAIGFQEDLIKAMMMVEDSYFHLAEASKRNVLVICDRGTMDASAFVKPEEWQLIMNRNQWNPVELRDKRYSQIIHMVRGATYISVRTVLSVLTEPGGRSNNWSLLCFYLFRVYLTSFQILFSTLFNK